MTQLLFERIATLLHRIKKQLLHLVWKQYNNVRYRYPGPHQATPFSEAASEPSVEVLWKGAAPPTQSLTHQYPFLNVGEIIFTPPYVLSIAHGRVVGKRGDVITPDGTIYTDISPEIPRQAYDHFLLNRGRTPQPLQVEGTVAVLNCGAHSNYFHFLFDTIARLQFFRQLDVSIDYYCVAQHQPFQKKLVSLFGIDSSKIIILENDTHLEARRLLATSLPGNHQTLAQVHLKDAATYHFVRDTVLAQINRKKTHAKLVYVQRKARRVIANEDALLRTLSALGEWQVLRLEEHSALEQAEIFYHAQVVVALHGAGLANTIYCQPGTHIVEIFSPVLLEPIYYQIAQQFDLQYSPIIVQNSQTWRTRDGHLNEIVTVDPHAVVQQLQSHQIKTM